MNRQSVIKKFIEKCGNPIVSKNHLFVYGSAYGKGHMGLTTKFNDSVKSLLLRYNEDHHHDPKNQLIETTAGHVLPNVHMKVDGMYYAFDTSDLLDCMRMLENKPFQKIHVFRWIDEPLPMLFNRSDCDISVILAPYMGEIPKNVENEQKFKYSGNPWTKDKPSFNWIKQANPKTTFWLVEFQTMKGSFSADIWGYPTGRMLKCRNCRAEISLDQWVDMCKRNHPECQCSCNTYDDFCGCEKNRERAKYDRLWRQQTVRKRFVKRSMM